MKAYIDTFQRNPPRSLVQREFIVDGAVWRDQGGHSAWKATGGPIKLHA